MRTLPFFRSASFILCGLLVLAASGCESDDDEITIDEFVGSWTATSVIHTNNANPAESFDIIANGGEVRFTILDGGKVRTWFELGAFSDEWDALATITGNVVTSVPSDEDREVRVSTFEYDGTTLTLTNVNDEFNFTNGVGPNASTTSVGAFIRH